MPLLDDYFEVMVADRLEQDFLAGMQERYRFLEGRSNYKLLYGQDYLAGMDPLPAIERGLEAKDLALPSALRPLEEAYYTGVAGPSIDMAQYLAPAHAYVRRIDPQGEQFTGLPPWLSDA